MTREYRKAKKEFMYTIIVGDYYAFNVYQAIDAANQVWYIGEPVTRGATRLADTEEELRKKLEADVPVLNNFLRRMR